MGKRVINSPWRRSGEVVGSDWCEIPIHASIVASGIAFRKY